MTPQEILDLLDRDLPAGILAGAALRENRTLAATAGRWRYDPKKAWREPGTSRYEEGVFAGPSGPDAITVAIAGPMDDPQSMADAGHIAAEANPPHALAAVARWRGVVERHKRRALPDPIDVCVWCPDGSTRYTAWPCPDLTETADEIRAYLGAAA